MIDWESISLKDLAGYLSDQLKKDGIEIILVGGACATIYSHNRYQSYDLDFVTFENMRKVKKALLKLGFAEKDRYFQHKGCPWFVEFVSPPVAVGNEPIHQFAAKQLPLGTIHMLRPEDSVKDRLASYFHWNDRQGLEQAIAICLESKIDFKEVETWAIGENCKEKFQEMRSLAAKE